MQTDPAITIEKIAPIHYQRLFGPLIVDQILNLSYLALFRNSSKLKSNLSDEDFKHDLEKSINRFRSDLIEYETKIDEKNRLIVNKIEVFKENMKALLEYGPIDEIDSINRALEEKITSVDCKLTKFLSDWQNDRSLLRSSSFISQGRFENFKHLSQKLVENIRQFEEFVELISGID